jgi:hypothetical protein
MKCTEQFGKKIEMDDNTTEQSIVNQSFSPSFGGVRGGILL